MKNIAYSIGPIVAIALLAACQQPAEQDNVAAAEPTADAEVAQIYTSSFVGKYALEDGCDDGKPLVVFTVDKINLGETSCSISGVSTDAEGLVVLEANQCTAEGEAQDDRSYTLEAGGMMSIEITNGETKTIAKRCEAFDAG